VTTPPLTTLAERIEQALRDAAFSCDGHCGLTERDCDAQHPIQVSAWHHGEVGSVYADIPALATVAAAAVQPELDAARAELAQLRQLFHSARDRADNLATEGDNLRAELATVREQAERYQLGALERAALLEDARDVLEAVGLTGAHGDDWPAISPAIQALAAERDIARQQLASARNAALTEAAELLWAKVSSHSYCAEHLLAARAQLAT
jgi:hypothetical protein